MDDKNLVQIRINILKQIKKIIFFKKYKKSEKII